MKLFLPAVVLVACVSVANASPLDLTFSPRDDGPVVLNVGETALIDIVLTGVDTGESLDSLAATVSVGPVARALGVTAGDILPSPLNDPSDLVTALNGSVADVAFLTFGTSTADQILGDGFFFTLEIEAQAVGASELSFTFADATLFNSANPDEPLAVQLTPGNDLTIEVVVPEPASAALAVGGLAAVASYRRRKH